MLADTVRHTVPRPRDTGSAPSSTGGISTAAGDAVALAYLVVALVVSVMFDGGIDDGGRLLLAGVAVLTVPVLVVEAARGSRSVRVLVLALGVGIVAAVAFAVHRADMTEAILAYSLPPVAFLTASRLDRRPWGRQVIIALLAASAVAYWGQAFLLWLQPPLEHLRSNWLAVFWHNPSGALMGTFGLLGAGVALRGVAGTRIAAGAISSLAFAGLWVTGSRGALIATAAGAAVTLVASRSAGWRRVATSAVLIAIGAVVVTVALLQVGGTRDTAPPVLTGSAGAAEPDSGLVRIESSAGGNLKARFAHMDAAMRVFARHPVTGAGPGSYGELGNSEASPGANLTLSAHNEFVEVLAEGGLLLGVPFLAAGIAIGLLALRRMRDPGVRDRPVDIGLMAGASGVVVLLLIHTAVDIDWRYPVIPALLAVAAALLVDREASSPPSSLVRGSVVLPVVAALVFGVVTAASETSARYERATDTSELLLPAAPWDVHRRVEAARVLARDGDLAAAQAVLGPAERWNTRSPSLDVMRSVLAFRDGQVSAGELLGSLDGQRTGARSYVWVAEALLDIGETRRARPVIAEGLALTDEHAGSPDARAVLFELEIRHAAATESCDTARDIVERRGSDEQVLRYVRDLPDRLDETLGEVC